MKFAALPASPMVTVNIVNIRALAAVPRAAPHLEDGHDSVLGIDLLPGRFN